MSANIVEQLDHIFKAESVAVIGASNNISKWGGRLLERAMQSNFRGKIFPVNPKEKAVLGLKAYADIRDIPDRIDLAVFTVPAAQMPIVMKSCVEKGIKGGVIISADFAETGEDGKALEDETVRIARSGNLRFVGPNGNGIWSSASGLNITPVYPRQAGPVGFISQSGSFGGVGARIATARGFGMSKFISIGNQADLTAADYLEYLGQDPDTEVIALYMEGFKDGARFVDTARRVVKNKPVLIMKGGRSSVGARATMSHTASIAGADEVFDAICRQSGLIRVSQIEHLFIMAHALFSQPLPKGKRIAVIGNGGQGVLAADNLVAMGMEIPEFSHEDQLRLKKILPPHAPMPRNPVDFAAGAVDTVNEVRVVETLASFDYIDAILTNAPREESFKPNLAEQKKEVIDAAYTFAQIPQKYGKPIILQYWHPLEYTEDIIKDAKIPGYYVIEECTLAMKGLVKYGEIKRKFS